MKIGDKKMIEASNTYRAKLKQLHKIKMTVMYLSDKNKLTGSPRMHEALQTSMVITLIVIGFGLVLDQLTETYFLIMLFAVFLIAAINTYKKSSRKDTWLQEIDEKLTDYDPVNVHAYKKMQKEISASDLTRISDFCPIIEEWLMVERVTIKELLNPVAIHPHIPHESKQRHTFKFVDKIVDKKEG